MTRQFIKFVFLFILCSQTVYAQEAADNISEAYTITSLRYWFDSDYSPREVAYANGTSVLDVSHLGEGFHTLHYQAIDSKGEASPSRTLSFFRYSQQEKDEIYDNYTITKLRYWFDSDYSPREVAYANGTSVLDVSHLGEGFHTLHYQAIDSKGEASPSRTLSFFRYCQQEKDNIFADYEVKDVIYWFDEDKTSQQTTTFTGELLSFDLEKLSEGKHILYFQIQTEEKKLSPVRSVDVFRGIYDIYISNSTEYADTDIFNNPLFATRPEMKLHFLPDDTNVRGHLTVNEGATLSLGKFVQTANWGIQHNNNMFAKTGADYYHPTTLLNNGKMRADSVIVKQSFYRDRWHFVSLPFNVNVSDIGVPEGTYYALRTYDGEARALGEMTETWRNLGRNDKMKAGQGYIVQLIRESDEKTAELIFKSVNDPQKNNIFTTADVTATLEEHQAEFTHNRGWNFVGNPYPSFYDSRCMDIDGTIIVWNGNGYTAYSLEDDNYILMPFEAFFIQKPLNADAITFAKEGRQHTDEVQPRAASPRRVSRAGQNRRVLNFILADDTDTDRSRVVINEQASMNYETGKDAPKFKEPRPQKPQLFSVESGVQYAINERPMNDGQVVFSIFAPTDGEYRLSVDGDASNMVVVDAENGNIWVLADGDYVFTATEGMHQARLIVSLTGEVTAIAQVSAYDDGEIKVNNGQLSMNFMREKHIKVFSLDGRMIFNDTTSYANVKVWPGVYLLDIDGKTTKIMVK